MEFLVVMAAGVAAFFMLAAVLERFTPGCDCRDCAGERRRDVTRPW